MMSGAHVLKIPAGFDKLLENFTREVLRVQPSDIPAFGARYFEDLSMQLLDADQDNEEKDSDNEETVESGEVQKPVADAAAGGSEEEAPFEPPKGFNRRRRVSVSAESMDPTADGDYELPVHPKDPMQQMGIKNLIKNNLMFKYLNPQQTQDIINAMFAKEVAAGEEVIVQGDDGDNFYVCESGEFDIIVSGDKVGSYSSGGSFGELALMYNTPRAATIKCTAAANLWAIDRVTFRRILMDTTSRTRRMYEAFLESVSILKSMEAYERVKLADALESKTYSDGAFIIRQGEEGNRFYLVEEGTVEVRAHMGEGEEDKVVKELSKGDYFGELALITKNPRAASVVAKGDVKCAELCADAFERILGKCTDIMKRNAGDYKAQLEEIFGTSESPVPAGDGQEE